MWTPIQPLVKTWFQRASYSWARVILTAEAQAGVLSRSTAFAATPAGRELPRKNANTVLERRASAREFPLIVSGVPPSIDRRRHRVHVAIHYGSGWLSEGVGLPVLLPLGRCLL